jgi:membrane associated rhomboid family serine protease
MMGDFPPATTVVLVITALVTLWAFKRPDISDRLIFDPYPILAGKQYYRMLTSGLIHLDGKHFALNAFSFYCFGRNIEMMYGARPLLVIYFSSILGGSLLSLAIHRNHHYRALGASGGVCGVIFASIFLMPGESITMFPIPIEIPAFVYAILFLAGSYIAHRRQSDNIGHDAHLGGAIIGLLVATAMYPFMITAAPWMFAVVLGVSLAILAALLFDPFHNLQIYFERNDGLPGGEKARRYHENRSRNKKLSEMDGLLDKVSRVGINGLSNSERQRLNRLSIELYGKTQNDGLCE